MTPSSLQKTLKSLELFPFLKFHSSIIEKALNEIENDNRKNTEQRPVLLSISGPEGSGRAQLMHNIIADYLYDLGIIKNKNGQKLSTFHLTPSKLEAQTVSDKLSELKNSCADSYLIVDGFNVKNLNTIPVIELIKDISASSQHKNCCVVLIGFYREINGLLETYELLNFFKNKYLIELCTPDIWQLVKIFEDYILPENYTVTHLARKEVENYFWRLKKISEIKYKILKAGIKKYYWDEYTFKNASEFRPFLNSILENSGPISFIDEQDVLNCRLYQRITKEYYDLNGKYGHI